MIFITVGVSAFHMDRLFNIIDELCDEGILNGKDVIAQIGFSSYRARNYQTVDLISRDEHHELLKKSDLIISHAGVGSVVTALKMGKKVIAFPRLHEYGEHVDNHQLEICDYFRLKEYILVAKDKSELTDCLSKVDSFEMKKYDSNNIAINKLIIDFIDSGKPVVS